MPALIEYKIDARVEALFHTPSDGKSIESFSRQSLDLLFDVLADEAHSGANRASCSRVKHIHPRGTEIRNERQLAIVSAEELAEIAMAMDLPELDPKWLGSNILLSGIPSFTLLPPSSRLQFPSGATIVIDMQNEPCHLPAEIIEREHEGKGRAFPRMAKFKRGVTAWVQRPGEVKVGDSIRIWVPRQPAYPHAIAGVH